VKQAGSGTGSQAIDRATALLDAVITSTAPRTFTALVEESGFAKSTTSRLLHALERGGLVRRDADGNFRAGPLFALYAARQNAVHDLAALAQPALDRLAQVTGETANFAVPRGESVVQIAQADGHYLLGTTSWLDVEVPPHCSALGKVFYAFGRLPLPTGRLEARTPATIVDPAALERDLATVRRRGWAIASEELEVGLVAIGAPVRAADGTVVGGASVYGPTARIPNDRLAELGALVVEEADSVSTQLGHTRKVGAA
jgi:DNA-binding IclR family transcriptional regulator